MQAGRTTVGVATAVTARRISDHVDQLGERYPPIRLDSVDRTIHDPRAVREQYGHVIEYLSRVELEVDRNVLELLTLLPYADATDQRFFNDVWQPQELQHGLILDRLQQDLGLPASQPDTATISPKIRILGMLAHLRPIQDVVRMLYYLTGAATEKSAILAYNRLSAGMRTLGESAIANTVVAPIRRQEPGHFAFYRMSAQAMIQHRTLASWQLHLTRFLRRHSFGVVGANNAAQRADFGRLARTLGIESDMPAFAAQIGIVERELLWARDQGMRVPDYILRALRDAVHSHHARAGAG